MMPKLTLLRKDGVVSYTRDYYGNLGPKRAILLPVRNLTIFLAHWCDLDHEKGQVTDLILAHNSKLPLRTLKIVSNTFCSARGNVDIVAIEKLFAPIHGLLSHVKVELVGFGEVLEEIARAAIGGELCNAESCSIDCVQRETQGLLEELNEEREEDVPDKVSAEEDYGSVLSEY
jgi:hypothetical protein